MSAAQPVGLTDGELKRRASAADTATRDPNSPQRSFVIDIHGNQQMVAVPVTARPLHSGLSPAVENTVPFFLVAFKICMDDDDHWMNKLAIWGTSSSTDDVANYEGTVSHTEIMFLHKVGNGIDRRWHRYSIMKTRGIQQKSGKIIWNPGRVHSIPTTIDSVKKYRFFKVEVTTTGANTALQFLKAQVDSPFNFMGYALNFIMPFKLGVRNYQQAMRKRSNKWFCSELVVCALQAAGVREMQLLKACAVSPNELYRMLLQTIGQPVEFEAYQHF